MDFSFETLCIIWFFVLGVLLIGYALLDGFDLGVGILHPFVSKTDKERRISINSIGPVWDGNEVWLVTFGGAMFAMFPNAYASIFSGFYLAFMLLLFSLISRAASLEFRSKVENKKWRSFWDYSFCVSSFLAIFLFGVAVGNIVNGISLDELGNFKEGLFSQLNFYSIMVGVVSVFIFSLHGSLYLQLKTSLELEKRVKKFILPLFIFYVLSIFFITILTSINAPRALINFSRYPFLWSLPIGLSLTILLMFLFIIFKKPLMSFILSCLNIFFLVSIFGASIFPYLIPKKGVYNINDGGLDIYLASSSKNTLEIGLYVVLIGMPLVLTYTFIVYRTFRGKVKLDKYSY